MRKHTPIVLSFVLLLFLAVLGYNIISLQANMNFRVNENEDEILAARVLNCTKIYVNKPVNLTTIINNPTTWMLKNITFSISLPLKTRIITILNSSLVNTSIEETDEEIIVSVNITQINSQSIFVHWLIIQFEEKGDYEKWNFGGDLQIEIPALTKALGFPFNLDATYDAQIDNLLNRTKLEIHKLKIGGEFEFNDLKILKILGSDFSLEKAAAYLTMNYFGLTGQGRIKNFQDDILYPGVEANSVIRLGDLVFIPTIGWNNEQKLYGGLVVAYSARKQKQ